MSQPPPLPPGPHALEPAQDYYLLRREGIGYIEQMGSRQWTDYNTHDPGITILESVSYVLTDLAYRSNWDIQDLLTPFQPADDPQNPLPDQPFFTARRILTVNPVTPDDFRRLLIDLDAVRNAWVSCKQCACDTLYHAWCEDRQLILSYGWPTDPKLTRTPVEPLGLYDVLIELEDDPELGDLNDRKLERTYNDAFDGEGLAHPTIMELRFPDWGRAGPAEWDTFLGAKQQFAGQNGGSFSLKVLKFHPKKAEDTIVGDDVLRRQWSGIFYASIEITLNPGGKVIIPNIALRVVGDDVARKQATVAGLIAHLEDIAAFGFIARYRSKLLKIGSAVESAKTALHSRRNLDEDYCRVQGVAAEDVAVCADVVVDADADIELVQAWVWFEIEQYLNPPVKFYTPQELMDAGVAVEDIFNGPELTSGFLKVDEFNEAGLKTELRASDIINRMMSIPGVQAVNNLLLTKYDAEGNPIAGAADPEWINNKPKFDLARVSAGWLLFVTPQHQPRLYRNLSRFLFLKNGLPFRPRMAEALDTLEQLHGQYDRPKIKGADNDLLVPAGTYRNPDDYFPVQYSFPLTYGIGPEGLPSSASDRRHAQARQLKAYLMIFEQLLGNAFTQLAHTADLFSLDPHVKHTYFAHPFSEALVKGYDELAEPSLDATALQLLMETPSEFRERRNRFLDHILARFGEQFGDYALLLTNLKGQQVALDDLIPDKIAFVKAYPRISHDRGRAFNYKFAPCLPDNAPGLKKRISLLLGYPDLAFTWQVVGSPGSPDPPQYAQTLTLADPYGATWLSFERIDGLTTVLEAYLDKLTTAGRAWKIIYASGRLWLELADDNGAMQFTSELLPTTSGEEVRDLWDALVIAIRQILGHMVQPNNYEAKPEDGKFHLILHDEKSQAVGQHPDLFTTEAAAAEYSGELAKWSSNERAILVEHLLLRPKFPGDALYPACTDGDCTDAGCGDSDPYSFRLTFVMPGWTVPFNTDIDMRGFADRTIQQETPSHLLGKTCWVGNDGFIANRCDPLIDDLARLLQERGWTEASQKPTCAEAYACAKAIYDAFASTFEKWYADRFLVYIHDDALQEQLTAVFKDQVQPKHLSCAVVLEATPWDNVMTMVVAYFKDTALHGWQFERFEAAWCQWLQANAHIDWSEERLQETLENILAANLVAGPASAKERNDALCHCAAAILEKCGTEFYKWMDTNVKAGYDWSHFTEFAPCKISLDKNDPDAISLCPGLDFKSNTVAVIEKLLAGRYAKYGEVSYRLRVAVDLLSKLRSTYPGATLHDCDEGGDVNPIRLDRTALGSLL